MKNSEKQPSTRPPLTIVMSGYVPSKKNRRILAFGKILPPKDFLLWQNAVKASVRLMTGGRLEPFDSDGPCSISLVYGISDLRRRDIDNMVTSWLDALQESGVLSDDSWTSVGCVESRIVYSPKPFSKATITVGNKDVFDTIKNIKEARCRKKQ